MYVYTAGVTAINASLKTSYLGRGKKWYEGLILQLVTPYHKCTGCILRLTFPMLFHSHSWNKTQVVPLALSLFDMPAVPVFRSAASVEDMRVGTEGGPPSTISHRQKESSQKTESTEAKHRHIVQIIYGWCSIHLKLRWNAGSFPTCRGISLNSVACSMCTMFHPDLRFSVLTCAYT